MSLAELKKEEVQVDDSTSVEEYVKEQFPIGKGEHEVRYCSVGVNRFRINFWTKTDPYNQFTDNKITRSHYVICTKVDGGWEHRIWED